VASEVYDGAEGASARSEDKPAASYIWALVIASIIERLEVNQCSTIWRRQLAKRIDRANWFDRPLLHSRGRFRLGALLWHTNSLKSVVEAGSASLNK
jgi:hypothetical protein